MTVLPLLDAALRGGMLALLWLLGLALLRDGRKPSGVLALLPRLGACLAVGLSVQVISSTPLFEAEVPVAWQAPWVAVSVANSVLFWLFARALFEDEFRLRPLHLLLWFGAAGLSGLNCAWLAPQAGVWPVATATLLLQRLLPLGFGLLVGLTAMRHWRVDLVDARRRLRAKIVLGGAVYMAMMVALRLQAQQPGQRLHGRLSEPLALLDVAALLVLVGSLSWSLLRVVGSELLGTGADCAPAPPGEGAAALPAPAATASEASEAPDAAEQTLLDALRQAMEQERFYRSEDPSLAALAQRLQVPEYRLRRLIHQRLGQRNFNSYINGYRLAEVRRALANPTQRSTPILTLALEAGFQSIGPFNRAFKAETGMTPSEFRERNQAAAAT
ncbi:AraC family transcriptional regulator [Paucibacter sp. Y2R2-4]|uniref:AraC family transcriptional regulator n=1 Tax=Paucibacter sp. Y2R2-4 TaxID=2893553 RepID=UPI0021E36C98|nr:AraC family transcriptional regulator [Paucibacter sp. Y2R2-4]MCV2351428.1 AraC family transcriptional regulator [Paucibacter sp. Y2R2-4]